MALTIETLQHEPASCSCAVIRNVMVVVWTGSATAPAVDLLTRMSEQLIATWPRGISGIHLIADKVPLPTPEGRAGLVKLTTYSARHLACLSIVMGGGGFWGSTMRSFITGLRLLTPGKLEIRVHGTVEEVLDWLPGVHEQRTGEHLDRGELARLLKQAWTWSAQSYVPPLFQPPDDLLR